jgi:hypothetical protein
VRPLIPCRIPTYSPDLLALFLFVSSINIFVEWPCNLIVHSTRTMRFLRAQQAVSLITCISAFAIRDDGTSGLQKELFQIGLVVSSVLDSHPDRAAAPLNQTTTISPEPTATEPTWTEPEIETYTPSREFRPHPEASATGFDELPTTTTMLRNDPTPSPPDIGSIIQSFLTTAVPIAPAPTVHTEQSQDGWLEVTPLPPTGSTKPAFHGPHMEISTDGFGDPTTRIVPAPDNGPQATTPLTDTTPPPSIPIPIVTPPPAITQGGLTLSPIPITSIRVTTISGIPTTVEATVNYRYAIGSSTLALNTPTTINNIVIALSLDQSGSTVLIAGGQTTTLPGPAASQQPMLQDLHISTTVIQGTTQYLIAGQTLAPGRAVTVGNVPISLGTNAQDSTVLVVGTVTTTLPSDDRPGSTALPSSSGGASSLPAATTAPRTGVSGTGPGTASSTTTTTPTSGEPRARAAMSWLLIRLVALGTLGRGFAVGFA